jgi:hypothetical protein
MAAKTAAGYGSRELAKFRATGMADLGIQPHVIEAVLNHVSGHKAGVAGIYNRSTYAKRETSGDGPVGSPYSGYHSAVAGRQCHQAGAQGLVSFQAVEQSRRAAAPACRTITTHSYL